MSDAGDTLLTINGEPFNTVQRREYAKAKQQLAIEQVQFSGGYEPQQSFSQVFPGRPEQQPAPNTELLKPQEIAPPPLTGFSEAELNTARLSPPCIVENYLYADLALLAAAGGTGKTTMLIYEAICIATGRDLWGEKIRRQGSVLFITAEDARELFAARLREILHAHDFSEDERKLAMARIHVWDVSGNSIRLAELNQSGNIQLTALADKIVEAYKSTPPVMVVFDPAISFSPGERVINDGEQALVTAARRIIRGLRCCVRYVHHTGKANAREGTLDQYSSRGGTALPDGCRMVAVLSSINGESSVHKMPNEFSLKDGESGFVMARSKLSFAPPQPKIFIKRDGYKFSHCIAGPQSKADMDAQDDNRVWEFINKSFSEGKKLSKENIATQKGSMELSRDRVRASIVRLIDSKRIVEEGLSTEEVKGARKTYIKPLPIVF